MTLKLVPSQMNLTEKALALFTVFFALELFYLGIVGLMVEQARVHNEGIRKARDVGMSIGLLINATHDLMIDGLEEAFIQPVNALDYRLSYEDLPKKAANLIKIAGDDPMNAKALAKVKEACDEMPGICELVQSASRRRDKADIVSQMLRMDTVSKEMFYNLSDLENNYKELEKRAEEDLRTQAGVLLFLSLILGFLFNAAIGLLLHKAFFTGMMQRLKDVTNDMHKVARGEPVEKRELGVDEIDSLALELRKMATTLQDFRSKEKTLLDNAASFICAINKEGTIVEVGSASSGLWGFAPDELSGRRLSSLIIDSNSSLEKLKTLFDDDTKSTISFENKLNRKDGSTIELSWKARLTEDRQSAVCVAQDVTKRNQSLRSIRASQEEFSSIVDSMPIAVITCDKAFIISSTNPAACRMLKCPAAELLTKNLSMLFTGDLTPGMEAEKQVQKIVGMAEQKPMELNVFRSDKTTLPVELHARNYPHSDKHLVAFQDVSARIEIENVKRDFVAMVSHDLRSPLTALYGTLEMVVDSDNQSSHPQADSLTKAQSIVAKLVNLINDFLDLEKFEAGMGVLEIADIELGELLERAKKTLSAPHLVTVSVDGINLDTAVQVDRERMAFALSNFLSSVIENSTGAVDLAIVVSEQLLKIKMTGHGCKFPSTTKDACLSRYTFSPLEEEHAMSSELGLALSRKVVEAHGGEVRFENSDEGFDLIVVTLPHKVVT